MKKLKLLIMLQLKNSWKKIQGSLNIKNKKLLLVIQTFLIISIFTPAIYFSIVSYKAFSQINQPELVITSMYVNAVILMFFLGIPMIASVFFFSKDTKFLITLPVTETDIIFSKLSTVYIFLLGISTMFLLPSIITYAIGTGFNISVIFFGIIAYFMAPLLPLLISALIILAFHKYIRKTKYKNILTVVSNIVLIVVIIVIQLGITQYSSNPEQVQNAILNNESFISMVGSSFPPSIWLTKMILGSIVDFLYFMGINLLFMLTLYYLAKTFFRKSMMYSTVNNVINNKDLYFKKHSIAYQLIKRHILIIVKEPTFLLNTLLSMIVPVILLALMLFSRQFSLDLLSSVEIRPYLMLIVSVFVVTPSIVSNISSTVITREGKAFWELKALPIDSKLNIKYRIWTTVAINTVGSFMLLILAIFIFPMTIEMTAIVLLFTIITTLLFATIDFIVNIYRPILNWTHPTAAVKNNLNVTISLGLRVVVGAVCYLLYLLTSGFVNSFNTLIIIISILFFIIYLITRHQLYSRLVVKFEEITV
ncbi:MAG: putative ABC transporter permease subunit [Bacillota bacterium]